MDFPVRFKTVTKAAEAEGQEYFERVKRMFPDPEQLLMFAVMCGVAPEHVVGWCSGQFPIPTWAWTIMRLLEQCDQHDDGFPMDLITGIEEFEDDDDSGAPEGRDFA